MTIHRWVQRFTPLLIDAPRPGRSPVRGRDVYEIAGRWVYLYRAIDQYGQLIDVLVSQNRDLMATRRLFLRALEHGRCPTEGPPTGYRPTRE